MYCACPSDGMPGRCWPGARLNSRGPLASSPVEGLARWPLPVRSGGAAAQEAPLLSPPPPLLPPPPLPLWLTSQKEEADCLGPTIPVSQAAGSQPESDSWATEPHVLQSAGGVATELREECRGCSHAHDMMMMMSRESCRRILRAATACEQQLPVGVLLDRRQTRHPGPKRATWDSSRYSTPSGLMHPHVRRRHPVRRENRA